MDVMKARIAPKCKLTILYAKKDTTVSSQRQKHRVRRVIIAPKAPLFRLSAQTGRIARLLVNVGSTSIPVKDLESEEIIHRLVGARMDILKKMILNGEVKMILVSHARLEHITVMDLREPTDVRHADREFYV